MSSQSMAPAPTPSGDKPQNLNALFKEVAEEIKAQVNGSKSAQVKEEWRKLFRLWNAGLHALAEAVSKTALSGKGNLTLLCSSPSGQLRAVKRSRNGSKRRVVTT